MNHQTLDASRPAANAPKSGRRMSGNKNDPGFALFDAAMQAGQSIRVLVDGVEAKNVVTADEAEGYVESLVVGLSGQVMTLPDGTPKLVRRTGAVRIIVS
jgi:hypothetical protein